MGGLVALASPAARAADDALLESGKGLYKQFCSHCHGIDMVNAGTSSYDLRKYPKDRRDDFLRVLHEGKGAMPPWGDILKPEEMDALWHYVATRGGKEEAAGAPDAPLAGAAAADVAGAPATLHEGRLTMCLAKNGGPMSSRRARGGTGLDYDLAAAIAAEMDLELDVAWFESEQEEESSPVKEAYALLAHGVCDLVSGFALYANALDGVAGTRASLPRWDERPATLARNHHVDLRPIAVTRPYLRGEIALVAREGEAEEALRGVRSLARLDGPGLPRFGIAQGTLGGAILARQAGPSVLRSATTLNPGPSFLWRMENGAFDATLISVAAYDMHRKQNPLTALRLMPYRHRIGYHLGLAGLASNRALVEAADRAIARLGEAGLRDLATRNGVTWAAPKGPPVTPPLTLADILRPDDAPAH